MRLAFMRFAFMRLAFMRLTILRDKDTHHLTDVLSFAYETQNLKPYERHFLNQSNVLKQLTRCSRLLIFAYRPSVPCPPQAMLAKDPAHRITAGGALGVLLHKTPAPVL